MNPNEATLQELIIYDAIIKKHYLGQYGLKPSEVNELPEIIMQVWNKIAKYEKERSIVNQNGN